MTVLVTGRHGQLATAVRERLDGAHRVVALSREQLDVTRGGDVVDAVRSIAPDVVVNGAAYNDVDGAEDDAAAALAVNALAVRALQQGADAVGATLVHYSTDFVFDGTAREPYDETSTPNPQSVYAMSKLLGEWFAQRGARHYVLRVESLFGGVRRSAGEGRVRGSSVDRMAEAMLDGREIRAFADRVVSPSYVDDVADATARLLDDGAPHGLYHCVGAGHGTWVEIATELAARLGVPATIRPVKMADQPLKATRPSFCALANRRLTALGISMPAWQDAVARYARGLRASRAHPGASSSG